MHLIKLEDVNHSEKTLTQAVLQVTQMLGIFHAELARILHLKCSDVGDLADAKTNLTRDSVEWEQAENLMTFYELLFTHCAGDEVCMHNWLRKHNENLNGAPLYIMVDELSIERVIYTGGLGE